MNAQKRLVMIDVDGVVVCPYHGEQPGAEYAPGKAPCGCSWVPSFRGYLLAENADLQQDMPTAGGNGHKGR